MRLGVQSYAELYTTLIGWQHYQVLWDILTKTGLIFLPFIAMFISHLVEPYKSQEAKEAYLISLRRVEVDFIAMVVIILLAGLPYFHLSPTVLKFEPICRDDRQAVSPGNTGTTYDVAFPTPTTVKIPIWWYTVMAISQGITSEAKSRLGCEPRLREMMIQVSLSKIEDVNIRQEVRHFYEQCFVPSRHKYLNEQGKLSSSEFNNCYGELLKKHGNHDPDWFGSHIYNRVLGYYDTNKAQQPIANFKFDKKRDWQYAQVEGSNPKWGAPYCNQWWNDESYGLKEKLYQVLPKSWWHRFESIVTEKDKENVLKKLIDTIPTGYAPANTFVSSRGWSRGTENVGVILHQMDVYPKLYAIQQGAPIVRALLLMIIYAMLPLALVFSRYSVKTLVTGAIMIFAIIFWAYLWQWIEWIENILLSALYTESWFTKQTPQATLADFIIGSLMIVLPLFWFSLMGSLGVAAGDVSQQLLSKALEPAIGSANSGVNVQRKAIDKIISNKMGGSENR